MTDNSDYDYEEFSENEFLENVTSLKRNIDGQFMESESTHTMNLESKLRSTTVIFIIGLIIAILYFLEKKFHIWEYIKTFSTIFCIKFQNLSFSLNKSTYTHTIKPVFFRGKETIQILLFGI